MADFYADYPILGGSGGSGDVVGPASAVNNDVAVFNGTTGKLIKDGGMTIAQIIAAAAGANFPHNTNILDMTGGTGHITANLATQVLYDTSDVASVDWGLRDLKSSAGLSVLSWQNDSQIFVQRNLFLTGNEGIYLGSAGGNGQFRLTGQTSFNDAIFNIYNSEDNHQALTLLDGHSGNSTRLIWGNLSDNGYGLQIIGGIDFNSSSAIDINDLHFGTAAYITGQLMYDASGFATMDWTSNRLLIQPSGATAFNWNSGDICDAGGTSALNSHDRKLYDNSSQTSARWDNGFSCPGTGSNSERFGFGAGSSGNNCVVVGNSADDGNNNNVVVLGNDATSPGSNYFVVGGNNCLINTVLIGNGYDNSSPANISFVTTKSNATTNAGGNFNITPGTGKDPNNYDTNGASVFVEGGPNTSNSIAGSFRAFGGAGPTSTGNTTSGGTSSIIGGAGWNNGVSNTTSGAFISAYGGGSAGGNFLISAGPGQASAGGAYIAGYGGDDSGSGVGGSLILLSGTSGDSTGIGAQIHLVGGNNGTVDGYITLQGGYNNGTIQFGVNQIERVNFVAGYGGSAPTPQTLIVLPLNVYGQGTITDLLGDPDAWIDIKINGTNYKLPAYLP